MKPQNELYDESKKELSSVLVQSGLQESWWAEAIWSAIISEMCRTYEHMVRPNERRFNSPFDGPNILFGAEIKFYPKSAKYLGRVHQFGTKVLPMRYASNAEVSWTGDLIKADAEDLKTLPPNQKRWTFKKETMNLYIHAGRAKSVIHRCVASGERPQARI